MRIGGKRRKAEFLGQEEEFLVMQLKEARGGRNIGQGNQCLYKAIFR